MQSSKEPTRAFGFVSVVAHDESGYSGGLLVLNEGARPLEFHCTVPVKPSRAQEILFGPTLKPYLFGEQIGQTLIQRAKTPLMAVFTDCSDLHALGQFVAQPVVWIATGDESARPDRSDEVDASGDEPRQSDSLDRRDEDPLTCSSESTRPDAPSAQETSGQSSDSRTIRIDQGETSCVPQAHANWLPLAASNRYVAASAERRETLDDLERQLETQIGHLDLVEPFARIRDAITETLGGSRAS